MRINRAAEREKTEITIDCNSLPNRGGKFGPSY